MRNAIRLGLVAGLAGAVVLLGSAHAQSSSGSSGSSSMGTSSGSSDTATGGAGASAGTGSTATGAPSAGKKINKKLQDDLEKLHAGNQAEIQAAQLGEANAQSADVKAFAQKMQSDHTKMDEQLTSAAQTLGVSLEGKTFAKEQQNAQKSWQKVQTKTGGDFDKAYMSQMVKDHEGALKVAKNASQSAQKQHQAELASVLQGGQTKIQGHLDEAKHLQKSLGKGGGTASSGSSSSMGTGSSGTSSGK
jgi:putative membrane protein